MIKAEAAPVLAVIDDEPQIADFVAEVALEQGFSPVTFNRAQDFIQSFPDLSLSGIVMDIVMPDVEGVELVRWLGERRFQQPVIVISGFDPIYSRAIVRIAEPFGVPVIGTLRKPVELDDLLSAFSLIPKAG